MTREVAIQNRLNWGKHCCCCWFGQKWPSNRIKNDSRIFEYPQDSRSSDCERGFWKENVVCTFCSTLLDTWAKGRSSHILPRLYRDGQCKQTFLTKLLQEMRPGVLPYDPETKRQSSEWFGETSPRPKKLKFKTFRIKTTLIKFSILKAYCTKNSYQREK